jgi:hypothetical protein
VKVLDVFPGNLGILILYERIFRIGDERMRFVDFATKVALKSVWIIVAVGGGRGEGVRWERDLTAKSLRAQRKTCGLWLGWQAWGMGNARAESNGLA